MSSLFSSLHSFYSEIYNLGGFKELEEKYGSWFSYSGSPRAQIFARNHTGVTDVDSMIKLMRWVWSVGEEQSCCGYGQNTF